MELRIIYGILIGTISGLLGGGLGLAGSLIMLPGLLLLNVIPDYRKTIGTILFSLLPPISLFAVIEYIKRKQVDYLIGIILCVTYFIGAYFGSIVNKSFNQQKMMYASGFILLMISLFLFYYAYNLSLK